MPVMRQSLLRNGGRHRPCGFSMFEVMVALAVLSVGLLGAAGMLLDSLRTHAGALHRLGATQLACDMADRIRANPRGRLNYDTRSAVPVETCAEAGCDAAQLAAEDRARFASAARALFTTDYTASVEFEPAIGPASPDRYVISLRWRDARDAADENDTVALQVMAQLPVAG